jgi:UDP-3-O-[3-hydroxymyristoyl] glucosamine N-acyltransferase
MRKTVREIADFIKGEVVGDQDAVITGVAGIEDAGQGDITFISNPKYAAFLDKTGASAIITSREITSAAKPLIRTENPSIAFVKAVSFILPAEIVHPKGIHPTAIIGKGVRLGKDVAIGPYTVIEDDVSIGDNAILYAHVYVGRRTVIGSNTLIYSNVTLRESITIGSRVIIHSGSVIGSDGFGYVTVEGVHQKIPQIGTVVVEDDVEIGSNVSIDRARFDKTLIGKGTKIDNLVHIAHNVEIGNNCLIVAQVGISGSTKIGNNAILAGQVGLVGHIKIGNNAVVMAQSGVNKSVPDGTMVWGYPAKPVAIARRVNASVQNLPRLYESVSQLKKKIEELTSKLEGK